jgi:glutathione S-transferase
VEERVHQRLGQLDALVPETGWIAGDFSVADLMLISVVMRVQGSGMLTRWPRLAAYVERGQARDAYARAFAAQNAVFLASSGQT